MQSKIRVGNYNNLQFALSKNDSDWFEFEFYTRKWLKKKFKFWNLETFASEFRLYIDYDSCEAW